MKPKIFCHCSLFPS